MFEQQPILRRRFRTIKMHLTPPPPATEAAVSFKAVVLLLLICSFVCFPLVVGVLSLLCCALLYVLSSFATLLKRKRELVALPLLSNGCRVTVNAL